MAISGGLAWCACALAGGILSSAAWGGETTYRANNLVSDGTVPAAHVDPHLVNPWGVGFVPNGYAWVADADSGYSTVYDGKGVAQNLVVAIPDFLGVPGQGHSTGLVYYGGTGFEAAPGKPSRFIFATEDGLIAAWSPEADATRALILVNESGSGASFKGLAIATGTPSGDVIYAADFANGVVRVYDSKFKSMNLPGSFSDPVLPSGYSPFGIQTIGSKVYIAFAVLDAGTGEEVVGPGLGIVDAFDTSGNFMQRMVTKGVLNAPWGIALAPDNFGTFSGSLLVGNFGDGRINAFNAGTGEFQGALRNPGGTPMEIEGLWGIAFGNGAKNQPKNALFFAAGISDESGGLYGSITRAGCYADFDGSGALDLFDFLGYVNAFNAQDPSADCTGGGVLDLFDFLCFVNAFNAGC